MRRVAARGTLVHMSPHPPFAPVPEALIRRRCRVMLLGPQPPGVVGALHAAGHEVAAPVPFAARREPAALRAAIRSARPDVLVHSLTDLPAAPVLAPGWERRLASASERWHTEAATVVAAADAGGVSRVVAHSLAAAYAAGDGLADEDAALDTAAPGGRGELARALAGLEERIMDGRQFVGVVLRHGHRYGPGTPLHPDGDLGRVLRARRLALFGGGPTSFVHAGDAAAAVAAAVRAGWGAYNIVDDDPAEPAEWLPALAAAVGAPAPPDLPWMPEPGDVAPLRLLDAARAASNARARAELGWRPSWPSWREGFAALGETDEPLAEAA